MSEVQIKDRKSYSVYGLFAAGSRFVDDYTAADAVDDYLDLHTEAERAAVTQELQAEIAKRA